MTMFEIDALEIVLFGNIQKMIEIDFSKSMVESTSQIS